MKKLNPWFAGTLALVMTASAAAQTPPSTPPASDSSSAPATAAPSDSSAATSEAPATPAPAAPAAAPAPLPPLSQSISQPDHPERWVAVVLAGASLITGAIMGGIAVSDQSHYNANPSQDLADETARDGMLSDIFLGVGVLSAAVAVVLFVEDRQHGERSDPTTGGRAAARLQLTGNGVSVHF